MANGGDNNDGLWMIFFILAFICVAFWGIWHVFKPQVLTTYLTVRKVEMVIASLWTDPKKSIETPSGPITFGEARQLINSLTPEILMKEDVKRWDIIEATTLATLKPLRIFFGLIFALMIYYAMFRGPTSFHRVRYNLDTLIKAQSEAFPIIKPIANFNPLKQIPSRSPGDLVPAELPLFAEALSPEEWIAFHRIPITDASFDQTAMDEAFALQLKDKWQGVGKLPPYLQVLLAGFALKAARKRNESDAFLGRLAACWSHKGGLKLERGLVSEARKILKDKNISSATVAECNKHGYITTALLGALDKARSEGGVLAPAQFLWLRGHERALWYPLNNLGRQAFHAEALGAMSHYRSEKHVNRPIIKPMLKDAIDVMVEYLEDKTHSHPIPQLDFSMIKNKKDQQKNSGIMKPAGT